MKQHVLIEINALSHLLNPKWMGRGKVPFFEGTPGNRSSGDGVGPVAQRIRARGYERCRRKDGSIETMIMSKCINILLKDKWI